MPYKDVAAKRLCQLTWLRKRREIWLAANGPCVGCGSNSSLQVDHIDPTQKVSHKIWSWSDSRRNAELAKCQALCRDCHRAKSLKAAKRDAGGRFLKQFTPEVYAQRDPSLYPSLEASHA